MINKRICGVKFASELSRMASICTYLARKCWLFLYLFLSRSWTLTRSRLKTQVYFRYLASYHDRDCYQQEHRAGPKNYTDEHAVKLFYILHPR